MVEHPLGKGEVVSSILTGSISIGFAQGLSSGDPAGGLGIAGALAGRRSPRSGLVDDDFADNVAPAFPHRRVDQEG